MFDHKLFTQLASCSTELQSQSSRKPGTSESNHLSHTQTLRTSPGCVPHHINSTGDGGQGLALQAAGEVLLVLAVIVHLLQYAQLAAARFLPGRTANTGTGAEGRRDDRGKRHILQHGATAVHSGCFGLVLFRWVL